MSQQAAAGRGAGCGGGRKPQYFPRGGGVDGRIQILDLGHRGTYVQHGTKQIHRAVHAIL